MNKRLALVCVQSTFQGSLNKVKSIIWFFSTWILYNHIFAQTLFLQLNWMTYVEHKPYFMESYKQNEIVPQLKITQNRLWTHIFWILKYCASIENIFSMDRTLYSTTIRITHLTDVSVFVCKLEETPEECVCMHAKKVSILIFS